MRIEYTGNEWLSMDSLQVRSLRISSTSAFVNKPLNRVRLSCNARHRSWSYEPRERAEQVAGNASK